MIVVATQQNGEREVFAHVDMVEVIGGSLVKPTYGVKDYPPIDLRTTRVELLPSPEAIPR